MQSEKEIKKSSKILGLALDVVLSVILGGIVTVFITLL